MAIVRYVNTDNTSGGDGTTPGTAGATRAAKYVADILSTYHMTTLTDVLRIYCVGTAPDTSGLDHTPLELFTTTANYLEIIGDNTAGKWNTNAFRFEKTNAHAIYNQYAAHVRLKNIQSQITRTSALGTNVNCFRLATANNDVTGGAVDHRYENCIARVVLSGGSGDVIGFIDSDPLSVGGTCRRINCVAYGGARYGFNSDASTWARDSVGNYNCTAYGNDFGFIDLQICVNCLGTGSAFTDFESTGTTGHSHNASGDATAGGTSSRTSQTFSFVDAASGDFHLMSTDAGAKGFGLTDPLSGLYTTDIDGNTRSVPWDIGADQYGSAVTDLMPQAMM